MNARANRLKKYKGFTEIYLPNGKMPKKGDIFKNTYLANTLEKIAKNGGHVFR